MINFFKKISDMIKHKKLYSNIPVEFHEYYKEKYSDVEVEMIIKDSHKAYKEQVEGCPLVEMGLGSDWAACFQLSHIVVGIQEIAHLLNSVRVREENHKREIYLSETPIFQESKFVLFMFDGVIAKKIKYYGKDYQGEKELNRYCALFNDYIIQHSNPLLRDAHKKEGFLRDVFLNLIKSYDNCSCQLNIKETVNFLYCSEGGKQFLPKSLIGYINLNGLDMEEENFNPSSNAMTKNNLYNETRVVFSLYAEALEKYKNEHSSRKNDALIERISLLLYSIDKTIAKNCGIEYPFGYHGEDKSKNKSQALKFAREKDIPKLQSLYPDLPCLPECHNK